MLSCSGKTVLGECLVGGRVRAATHNMGGSHSVSIHNAMRNEGCCILDGRFDGHFEVEPSALGKGGFGAVYSAKAHVSDRPDVPPVKGGENLEYDVRLWSQSVGQGRGSVPPVTHHADRSCRGTARWSSSVPAFARVRRTRRGTL